MDVRQKHLVQDLFAQTFKMAQAKPSKRKSEEWEHFCPNPMINRVLNQMPEVTVRTRRALNNWQKCHTEMGILSQIKVFLAMLFVPYLKL